MAKSIYLHLVPVLAPDTPGIWMKVPKHENHEGRIGIKTLRKLYGRRVIKDIYRLVDYSPQPPEPRERKKKEL